MSRKYICDVINSLLEQEFEVWVNERKQHRNEEKAKKKDLLLSLDIEIAQSFQASQSMSCKYQFYILFYYLLFSIKLFANLDRAMRYWKSSSETWKQEEEN